MRLYHVHTHALATATRCHTSVWDASSGSRLMISDPSTDSSTTSPRPSHSPSHTTASSTAPSTHSPALHTTPSHYYPYSSNPASAIIAISQTHSSSSTPLLHAKFILRSSIHVRLRSHLRVSWAIPDGWRIAVNFTSVTLSAIWQMPWGTTHADALASRCQRDSSSPMTARSLPSRSEWRSHLTVVRYVLMSARASSLCHQSPTLSVYVVRN